MTITSSDTRNEYTAAAGQMVFTYSFKIFAATDLNVYQTAAGQECADSDLITTYTVQDVGVEDGGTITLNSAATAGDLITIVSAIPETRGIDYQNNGDFIPDTVNDDFDKVYSIARQARGEAQRGLQFPECLQGSTSLTLPTPAALQWLRWRADMGGLENVDPSLGTASDSSIVNYNQGGAEAITRTTESRLQERVSVLDFGALGDGVTDDTDAIQNAINSGAAAVYFPGTDAFYKTTDVVNASVQGQRLFGDGELSLVKNTAAVATDITTINVTADYIVIDGLHVSTGADTDASLLQGVGILINADNCKIQNNYVTDFESAGILIYNGNTNIIVGNHIFNSKGSLAASTDFIDEGVAIGVQYNGTGNVISENVIDSVGWGVIVQTIDVGNLAFNNIISNNRIRSCSIYGIMAYRNDETKGVLSLTGTVISNNNIQTVTGAAGILANPAGQQFVFGAGIYIQGAEHTIVVGNKVNDTNSNTEFEQLAPGGIGITNCSSVIVEGNFIRNAEWDGIHVNEPNDLGIDDGEVKIIGNKILGSARQSIYMKDTKDVSVIGNHVEGGMLNGIFANSTLSAKSENILISGNMVKNCTQSGININWYGYPIITNNVIFNNGVHGISLSNNDFCTITGNQSVDNTTYGITAGSTSLDGICSGNYCKGNNYNFNFQVPMLFEGNRYLSPGTADFIGGSFNDPVTAFGDGDTTPSVKYADEWTTGNTAATSITGFDDGIKGQRFTIRLGDANTIFVNSGSMQLAGSVNFAAAAGDTITFMCTGGAGSGATNVVEVARMVR